MATHRRRVCVLGATGTIGRAVVAALIAAGVDVVAVVRQQSLPPPQFGVEVRSVDLTDPDALVRVGFAGGQFDAVISCIASRTGVADDAWAVDYQANLHALAAAHSTGTKHFILLSAICVQKPQLAFQHAKLAFEAELAASGLRYTIVRPTAFFKSLSGQVERVRGGKPFLIFGDGTLTACKPISDRDLAQFIVDCINDEGRWNRILPIGGPGNAITPREQGEALFAMLGRPTKFKSVPTSLLRGVAAILGMPGRLVPTLAVKAELARIGHYYATESMLVINPATGLYDAEATLSVGTDTLFGHYQALLAGGLAPERGSHAVF